jgi:hypothetical protein
MSKESFDLKLPFINSISTDKLKVPDKPVAIALQEAEDLYNWALQDKEALIDGGLKWNLVEDLPLRTGACRYIQTQWQTEYKSIETIQKEWKRRVREAKTFHDEVIHDMFHAYSEDSVLIIKLRKMSGRRGNANLIQNLNDISVLGKANKELLKQINFDLTMLEMSAKISKELGELLAEKKSWYKGGKKQKILRDKAYAYLKEAVTAIRHSGKYVFWHDSERKKGYTSNFLKKKNQVRKQKTRSGT